MDKLIKILIWPVWIVPAIYLAIVWDQLPERVPLKYNLKGEVSRYGDKDEFLLVIALMIVVNIGLYFLLVNLNRVDPKKKYTPDNLPRMRRMAFAICALLTVISCFLIFTSMHPTGKFNSNLLVAGIGMLFVILGNYMYNIKPNYFAGFRLPWTLENETNWRRTHLLAGKLWFAGGIIISVMALLLPENVIFIFMVSMIAILTLVPVIYSYNLYKNGNQSSSN